MSRKSPTITKSKICKNCNNEYLPTSNRQFYCKSCIPIMDKARKLKHYLKTNPRTLNQLINPNCCICGDAFSSHYQGKPSSNNSSGYPGIKLTRSGKYYTRITVDYNEIYLGTFDNFEDAVNARKSAENKYYGEYAPNNLTL